MSSKRHRALSVSPGSAPSSCARGTCALGARARALLTTVPFQPHRVLSCRCWQRLPRSLTWPHTDGPGPCSMMWGFSATTVLFQAFGV